MLDRFPLPHLSDKDRTTLNRAFHAIRLDKRR